MIDEPFDYQQQQNEQEHQQFDGADLVIPPIDKNVKITEIHTIHGIYIVNEPGNDNE